MKARPAYVLGNGPSLRGFDFARNLRGRVSFGMNLAFRYWHCIGWYPTYYSCLDEVVGMHHLKSIGDLVENQQRYGIRGFCLRRKVIQALDMASVACVQDYEQLLERWPFYFRSYWSSTGSKTLAWASWLGYRNIILLGVDANYIKYVKNARHINDLVLTLDADPGHNPNYFFDGYQQPGDLYHVPMQNNPDFPHEDQRMGWHMIRPQLEGAHTLVVNASPRSGVDAFPKCTPNEARPLLRRLRQRKRRQRCGYLPLVEPSSCAPLDLLGLAMQLHGNIPGTLLDMGSYHGQNCLRALRRGWQVCAAEADEVNAAILKQRLAPFPLVYIEEEAISCVSGRSYPWFRNANPRWDAMQDIVGNGVRGGNRQTVTVRDLAKRAGIKSIDILMLDLVGFEFMALRGAPFEEMPPACIIACWNDAFSLQLGNDVHDMGAFLLSQNYTVFISEWRPGKKPGLPWQWHGFAPYPARPLPRACGQLIAFRSPPSPRRLHMAVRSSRLPAKDFAPAQLPPHLPKASIPHVIRF